MFELGVAYYPDYLPARGLCRLSDGSLKEVSWHEHVIADLERMQRCGITSIRMAEFSWSTVEPERGKLDFERFTYVLDNAAAYGIRAIMCTPTATPPKWLIDEDPSILPMTREGKRTPFGARRHYDVCNSNYFAESKRIVTEYARVFGNHEAVAGWQVDNEFGCHGSVWMFTEAAREKFHIWLRQKYRDDISALNENWFTAFWSQGYTSFDQIELPFAAWADQNPHLELDFRRFCNDIYRGYQAMQVEILREHSPGRFITHNFMSQFTDLCAWTLSEDLDQAGFDHYQMDADARPVTSHWQFALLRSLKQKPFLVLEQQPVQVNWRPVNRRFEYDWLFLWTAQAAMLGARAVHYFSWQRFFGGAEQYHDGIIPHDLRVDKSWQERLLEQTVPLFKKWKQEFGFNPSKLEDETGADVLCIYDFESVWTDQITAQSSIYSAREQVDFVAGLCAYGGYRLCFAKTLESAGDLSRYQALVLPGYAFELSPPERTALAEFKGAVLTLPRTAMKKRNNQMSAFPLSFYNDEELLLEDYGALDEAEHDPFATESGVYFSGSRWSEKIKILKKWRAIAVFTQGFYAGSPAVLRRDSLEAKGHVHMAMCPPAGSVFGKWLLAALRLDAPCSGAEGVQLCPISRQLIGAVNFSDEDATVLVKSAKEAFISRFDERLDLQSDLDRSMSANINLPRRAVALIRRA